MDSFTLLHYLLAEGYDVHALSVNYGQRHKRELVKALSVCEHLGVPHEIVYLPHIADLCSGSSLTDSEVAVPEGHYEEESMKATVVPGRNLFLLSLAYMRAASIGAQYVAYGAHAGDHAIYPDCRPAFVNQLGLLFSHMEDDHEKAIHVVTPFIELTKGGILKEGLARKLDYSQTWTCYKGEDVPCGRCGACVERKHAFAENQAEDPLGYADAEFLKIPS